MDVPTRQSYVMAVVPPSARTYASGMTNVARNAGWALGPLLGGTLMQHLSLSDRCSFFPRHLRPPEERPLAPIAT